ncbi:MAG: hypothetical protein AAFR11_05560 [Pseudomonadota bacterium]
MTEIELQTAVAETLQKFNPPSAGADVDLRVRTVADILRGLPAKTVRAVCERVVRVEPYFPNPSAFERAVQGVRQAEAQNTEQGRPKAQWQAIEDWSDKKNGLLILTLQWLADRYDWPEGIATPDMAFCKISEAVFEDAQTQTRAWLHEDGARFITREVLGKADRAFVLKRLNSMERMQNLSLTQLSPSPRASVPEDWSARLFVRDRRAKCGW